MLAYLSTAVSRTFILYLSRASKTQGGLIAATWTVLLTKPWRCRLSSPPAIVVRSLSGSRTPKLIIFFAAVCGLPPMVSVANTLPLRSFTDRYSGRLTNQKIGRRRLTETTRRGAPRWIALIALPMGLTPAHLAVPPAALAVFADI